MLFKNKNFPFFSVFLYKILKMHINGVTGREITCTQPKLCKIITKKAVIVNFECWIVFFNVNVLFLIEKKNFFNLKKNYFFRMNLN